MHFVKLERLIIDKNLYGKCKLIVEFRLPKGRSVTEAGANILSSIACRLKGNIPHAANADLMFWGVNLL